MGRTSVACCALTGAAYLTARSLGLPASEGHRIICTAISFFSDILWDKKWPFTESGCLSTGNQTSSSWCKTFGAAGRSPWEMPLQGKDSDLKNHSSNI